MPDEWTKTVWQSGDLVTAAKLNKIEDQLENLTENSGSEKDPEIVTIYDGMANFEFIDQSGDAAISQMYSPTSELLPFSAAFTVDDETVSCSSADIYSSKLLVEFNNANIYTFVFDGIYSSGGRIYVSYSNPSIGAIGFFATVTDREGRPIDLSVICAIHFDSGSFSIYDWSTKEKITSGTTSIPVNIYWPNDGTIKYVADVYTESGGGNTSA